MNELETKRTKISQTYIEA